MNTKTNWQHAIFGLLIFLGAGTAFAQPFTYQGGSVIPAARLVIVYLGVPDPSFKNSMDNFYNEITNSVYTSWLSEYSVSSNTITNGTIAGSYVLAVLENPSFDPAGIGGFLDEAIHLHLLPDISDTNIVYMVHVAPTVSVVSGILSNGVPPGAAWCAMHVQGYFHGTGRGYGNGGPITYAILPSMSDVSTCWPAGGTAFQAETINATHELLEMITDPSSVTFVDTVIPPHWNDWAWVDYAQSGYLNPTEIADVCSSSVTIRTSLAFSYSVASAWKNSSSSCFAPNPTLWVGQLVSILH